MKIDVEYSHEDFKKIEDIFYEWDLKLKTLENNKIIDQKNIQALFIRLLNHRVRANWEITNKKIFGNILIKKELKNE